MPALRRIRPSALFVLALAAASVMPVAAVPSAAAAPRAPSPPGSLDTSFGGDGAVTTNLTKGFDAGRAVAIQADGRIVVAGTAAGGGGRFALVRYRRGGNLDRSFGTRGRVTTNLTSGADVARGVAIGSDGKIAVAGMTGTPARFALARYEADGTLDPSFGGDGTVTTAFRSKIHLPDGATTVAIQPDGKILAAGIANGNCTCERFAVVRYDQDGTLDRSFGVGGKATTHFKGGGEPSAMALGGDGRIVLVGGSIPDVDRFQIAVFEPDGSLDTGFSGNGKALVDMGQGEEAATGVAIQRNGRIVVSGYTDLPHEAGETFGPARFALARLDAGGALDPSFGTGGKVTTAFDTDAMATGMALQADGKVVVVGGSGGRFALARYLRNGSLDATFGTDGQVTTNLTKGEDGASAVTIQANGRIVAAGMAGGRGGRFAAARYLG